MWCYIHIVLYILLYRSSKKAEDGLRRSFSNHLRFCMQSTPMNIRQLQPLWFLLGTERVCQNTFAIILVLLWMTVLMITKFTIQTAQWLSLIFMLPCRQFKWPLLSIPFIKRLFLQLLRNTCCATVPQFSNLISLLVIPSSACGRAASGVVWAAVRDTGSVMERQRDFWPWPLAEVESAKPWGAHELQITVGTIWYGVCVCGKEFKTV